MPDILTASAVAEFSEETRRAIYEVIGLRRDVRHFDPSRVVDETVLTRILGAAHLAPSVGFSQPWGFVLVQDAPTRTRIRNAFLRVREAESARFPAERRAQYLSLKLEGILDAPVNVCVTVDLRPRDEAILGTTAQPEAVRMSACCAVQNFWLAARAEGIGVGWVSIVEPQILRNELSLPPGVEPIAYLCVGHPLAFRDKPMLEELGWKPRRPLQEVVHPDSRWQESPMTSPSPLVGEGRDEGQSKPVQRVDDSPPPSSPPTRGEESERRPPVNEEAAVASRKHQELLTKPKGSLGKLEDLAAWYAAARGAFPSRLERKRLVIFAADHGLAVEGVGAYGSQLTAQVVANVMAGGAAINSLAKNAGVEITLVDVGVAGDLTIAPQKAIVPLVSSKVRHGTGNIATGPAMTPEDLAAALAAGENAAHRAVEEGADLLGVGEIGIGNTTAAAALVCAFSGAAPEDVVGRGTGIDDATLSRKIEVVRRALQLHKPNPKAPRNVLTNLGGLEIAALAGFLLEAARLRRPVVLDGFTTAASALAACAFDPNVRGYLLAAHLSAENGHRIALDHLGLPPLLAFGMRLGEGTGAVLAMNLVQSAVALQLQMATFATAGIIGRPGTDLPPAS